MSAPHSSQETTVLHLDEGLTTTIDWHVAADSGQVDTVYLLIPALGVSARSYARLGQAIAAAGAHLAVIDLRGVGNSNVRARRGVDWGYLDLIDQELPALWRAVDQRLPSARKVWLGHSLGGHLALMHQARHHEQPVDHIALVASGSPWYRKYPGAQRWAVRGFGAFARASSRALGVFRGDLFGFGGAQGQRLMREWGDFCTTGRLPPLGDARWDPYAHWPDVRRRKFALVMRGDRYAPLAATQHLASLIDGELAIEQVDTVDGSKAPGHFLWMRHPEQIALRLLAQAGAIHSQKSGG